MFRLLITTTTTTTVFLYLCKTAIHLTRALSGRNSPWPARQFLDSCWVLTHEECWLMRSVDGVPDHPLNNHFAINSACLINTFMKPIICVVYSPPTCKHIFNSSIVSSPLLSSLPPWQKHFLSHFFAIITVFPPSLTNISFHIYLPSLLSSLPPWQTYFLSHFFAIITVLPPSLLHLLFLR